MLGVRPEYDGLRRRPVPAARTCRSSPSPGSVRGATYVITVKNSGGSVPRLTVDGSPVEGRLVPYAAPGSTVNIHCDV